MIKLADTLNQNTYTRPTVISFVGDENYLTRKLKYIIHKLCAYFQPFFGNLIS